MRNRIWMGWVVGALLALGAAGCGGDKTESGTDTVSGANANASLSGSIAIDGSGTVFPITNAATEEFMGKHPGVRITVGDSGTGAGMKKFLSGETDICDASRPIEDEEVADAAKAGIEFIEVPIAYDGLSIIVNPANTWVDKLTTEELKRIWEPGSKVMKWSDVRPGFPDKPIHLFGPSTAHGTFEYFTEAIVEQKKKQRPDFQQCPEYNQLVEGVATDENALGYVGYAYYEQNKARLKLVPVDSGSGPVAPSEATIADGTYSPLSRPLFVYVKKSAMARAEVKAFVDYLIGDGRGIIGQTGYVPFPDALYTKVKEHVDAGTTGRVPELTKLSG
ncbi:MAG: PstS family phosphate ABC transporter substrate-binding protein [Chthonomonadaceae bacterium]|nr:PstS family phosphate ABC transporter substrate-binding protein [Chthonomonadaceae bacterium]